MNENIIALLNKIAEDEDLRKQFENCQGADEAYALASSVQDGFTKDEFVTIMTDLYNQVNDELSTEDLEDVAGGMTEKDKNTLIWTTVIGGGLTVGGGIGLTYAVVTAGAALLSI